MKHPKRKRRAKQNRNNWRNDNGSWKEVKKGEEGPVKTQRVQSP